VELNRYDRATLGLWARGHAELTHRDQENYLAWVAVHAILAGLRRETEREALFASYACDPAADFTLIGSLLGSADNRNSELPWQVRDAAYCLRWREIHGDCI